jgi:A/G-specific adenine glycosylase
MTKKEQRFVETVWRYYREHGRHDLPWRQRSHLKPYNILVSEVMLQQTQVDRVVPKYQAFIKAYPNVKRLAAAPLGDVLRLWQGLGYNRRAKLLHECATQIVGTYDSTYPNTYQTLQELPGVGPYTAGAVMAFAYNQPVSFIETNIRTVYLHHFFAGRDQVSDAAIREHVTRTLDQKHPREWYWAIMDYGSHLKRTQGNQNHRSRHYTKQSRFPGSDRQVRGAILRSLTAGTITRARLQKAVAKDLGELFSSERTSQQLTQLVAEGLVEQDDHHYQLPS